MKEALIRTQKSKQVEEASAAESAEEASDEIYVGMQVEARFGGKGKWIKATVMKEHASKNGNTYDLKYADGRSVSEQCMPHLCVSASIQSVSRAVYLKLCATSVSGTV